MSKTEIPEWAFEKAQDLRVGGEFIGDTFARYIAAHEEPPVDPLLAEAIELVISEDVKRTENQIAAIRARRAGHEKVNLALAALRRGIALATGQSVK